MARQGHSESSGDKGASRLATEHPLAVLILQAAHRAVKGVPSSLISAVPVGPGNLLPTFPRLSIPHPILGISCSAQARYRRQWRFAGEGLRRQVMGGAPDFLWGPHATQSSNLKAPAFHRSFSHGKHQRGTEVSCFSLIRKEHRSGEWLALLWCVHSLLGDGWLQSFNPL